MTVPELYKRGGPVFSFEFFLPKTAQDLSIFEATLKDVKKLSPDFVTLTYGAGGSARESTVEMAGRLRNEFGFFTMMHLTCITHTRGEIESIAGRIKALGINHIMALRGDVPKDGVVKPLEQRDYKYASDLVRHLKSIGGFTLGVGGYPEGHPETPSKEKDLANLKTKVDSGADFITTQLFFDNQVYFDFKQRAQKLGISIPIVPGIMPITNYSQIQRFIKMCGAGIPEDLLKKMETAQNDPEAVSKIGIEHALKQCRELLDKGAPGIHFYTLNKSHATQTILENLKK